MLGASGCNEAEAAVSCERAMNTKAIYLEPPRQVRKADKLESNLPESPEVQLEGKAISARRIAVHVADPSEPCGHREFDYVAMLLALQYFSCYRRTENPDQRVTARQCRLSSQHK